MPLKRSNEIEAQLTEAIKKQETVRKAAEALKEAASLPEPQSQTRPVTLQQRPPVSSR